MRTASMRLGILAGLLLIAACSSKPDGPTQVEQTSHAAPLLENATRLERSGKYDAAIAAYRRVLKEYPDATDRFGDPYSYTASHGISRSQCLKRKGPDYRTANLVRLELIVASAFRAGSVTRLDRLASCDFGIGETGTEFGAFTDPRKVLPSAVRAVKGSRFEGRFVGTGDIKSFSFKHGKTQYMLTFYGSKGKNWRWIGMQTSDDKLVETWLKAAK